METRRKSCVRSLDLLCTRLWDETTKGGVNPPFYSALKSVFSLVDSPKLWRTVDPPRSFNGSTEGTNWFSSWVLVSRSSQSLKTAAICQATLPPINRRLLWTDDRASLLAAYWMNRRDNAEEDSRSRSQH